MNDNRVDIDWWHSFKEGDRDAFDCLFRRYYPILVQYGSKMCQDKELLEDAIQDLFIELWQSKANTPIQSVKAYFLKALKYKLFRQFKNSRPKEQVEQVVETIGFTISHDHFIVQREDEMGTLKKISSAINRLPARQKEIVYLRIYQELTYDEISEVMSINYQVARNLFHQSLKSLRSLFLNQ